MTLAFFAYIFHTEAVGAFFLIPLAAEQQYHGV